MKCPLVLLYAAEKFHDADQGLQLPVGRRTVGLSVFLELDGLCSAANLYMGLSGASKVHQDGMKTPSLSYITEPLSARQKVEKASA